MCNKEIIDWILKKYEVTIIDFGNYMIISFLRLQKQIKIKNLNNKNFEQAKKEINSKITDLVVNAKNE